MGEMAVENMFGAEKTLDRDAIPGAFFTALEVGTVGLTEPEARERYDKILVGHFPYQASGRAKTTSSPEGFSKVVANANGRIVGIHIAGKQASEMVCAASLAVSNKLTIDDWKKSIIAHPTFGEILKEAVLDCVDEAIHV
jgi:dihydrolipoamide dehydrogenase